MHKHNGNASAQSAFKLNLVHEPPAWMLVAMIIILVAMFAFVGYLDGPILEPK